MLDDESVRCWLGGRTEILYWWKLETCKLMNPTHFWGLSMNRTASTAVVIILECENTYHRSVLSVSLEYNRDSSSLIVALWEANIRMESKHFQE